MLARKKKVAIKKGKMMIMIAVGKPKKQTKVQS